MRINRQGVALQMSPSACESITMLFWTILEQDPVFFTYIIINECKIYMTLLLRLRIPSFLPCPYYDSLSLSYLGFSTLCARLKSATLRWQNFSKLCFIETKYQPDLSYFSRGHPEWLYYN